MGRNKKTGAKSKRKPRKPKQKQKKKRDVRVLKIGDDKDDAWDLAEEIQQNLAEATHQHKAAWSKVRAVIDQRESWYEKFTEVKKEMDHLASPLGQSELLNKVGTNRQANTDASKRCKSLSRFYEMSRRRFNKLNGVMLEELKVILTLESQYPVKTEFQRAMLSKAAQNAIYENDPSSFVAAYRSATASLGASHLTPLSF